MPELRSQSPFGRIARVASHAAGSGIAFAVACLIVVVWLATGPIFRFGETWQLVINTGTTIVTFLMIFLLQNAQNRDAAAVQIKLDELIRAVEGAHNAMLDLEKLDQKQLEAIRERYSRIAEEARDRLARGGADTDAAKVPRASE